jgi:hypothetical protein
VDRISWQGDNYTVYIWEPSLAVPSQRVVVINGNFYLLLAQTEEELLNKYQRESSDATEGQTLDEETNYVTQRELDLEHFKATIKTLSQHRGQSKSELQAVKQEMEGLAGQLTSLKQNQEQMAEQLDTLSSPTSKTTISMIPTIGTASAGEWMMQEADQIIRLPTGFSPVLLACTEGNGTALAWLHAIGCSLATKDSSGNTATHLAASNGHLDILNWLSSLSSLTPHARNNLGEFPCHLAAKGGHTGVIKLLHENGASLHEKTQNGDTSWTLATQNGHLELLEWLKDQECFVDGRIREGKSSAHCMT